MDRPVGIGAGAFFAVGVAVLVTPLDVFDRAPSGLLTSARPTESLLIVSLDETEGLERCVAVVGAGSLVALEVVVLRTADDDVVGTAGFFFSGVPTVGREELAPIVETRLLAAVDVVDAAVRELLCVGTAGFRAVVVAGGRTGGAPRPRLVVGFVPVAVAEAVDVVALDDPTVVVGGRRAVPVTATLFGGTAGAPSFLAGELGDDVSDVLTVSAVDGLGASAVGGLGASVSAIAMKVD